jgi:hypothetical protein
MRREARLFLVHVAVMSICSSSLAGDGPYFPERAFDKDDQQANDARASGYSEYPDAMDEPSMWKVSKSSDTAVVYRLLWIPSFYSSISVRIVKSGESATLHAVQLDLSRGERPGKISVKRTRKLTKDEWTLLEVHLLRSRYWDMKTLAGKGTGVSFDLDGDSLVCEGIDGGRYHVVDRSDPNPEYEKLCKFILDLSGLDIKKAWETHHCEVDGQ